MPEMSGPYRHVSRQRVGVSRRRGRKNCDIDAHTDVVFFTLDGGHTSKPACSADSWALSLSTHSGRAMYALLLSAQSQGKQVWVHGTGACAAWGDREEPQYVL